MNDLTFVDAAHLIPFSEDPPLGGNDPRAHLSRCFQSSSCTLTSFSAFVSPLLFAQSPVGQKWESRTTNVIRLSLVIPVAGTSQRWITRLQMNPLPSWALSLLSGRSVGNQIC
jgi:hypothetical protein